MGGGEYQLVYWECTPRVDEPMTLNDLTLNAKCLQIGGISKRLNVAMRDGRMGELEVALAAIEMLAGDALDRIKVLRAESQSGDLPPKQKEEVKP